MCPCQSFYKTKVLRIEYSVTSEVTILKYESLYIILENLFFCYCQLNYPADRIRNPVLDNKYGSLKMHQEAFVDCQQCIGAFKGFPKQFPG